MLNHYQDLTIINRFLLVALQMDWIIDIFGELRGIESTRPKGLRMGRGVGHTGNVGTRR